MKVIVYTPSSGGEMCVCTPAPWARTVSAIIYNGERVQFDLPIPLDMVMQKLKPADAPPEWAETLSPEWFQTEDEFVKWVMAKDVPADAINPHIVDASDLAALGPFPAARVSDGKTVSIDMSKARAVHRKRMNEVCVPHLESLDVAYIRADEAGNDVLKKSIVDQKRVFRDVTKHPDIDAATTPEEIHAVWPKCLGERL